MYNPFLISTATRIQNTKAKVTNPSIHGPWTSPECQTPTGGRSTHIWDPQRADLTQGSPGPYPARSPQPARKPELRDIQTQAFRGQQRRKPLSPEHMQSRSRAKGNDQPTDPSRKKTLILRNMLYEESPSPTRTDIESGGTRQGQTACHAP